MLKSWAISISVGAPTCHHISFFYSVLCFTSQLSFLCLHINPHTNPDNSCLTVTYSVMCFSPQQDPPLTSIGSTHQIRLQLFLHYTSEHLSLSPPHSHSSLCSPLHNQAPLPIRARHSLAGPVSVPKYPSQSILMALAEWPVTGPQQAELHSTSHTYQLCQPANGRPGWTASD